MCFVDENKCGIKKKILKNKLAFFQKNTIYSG